MAGTAAVATKSCPSCGELVPAKAVRCKHCGTELVSALSMPPPGYDAEPLHVPLNSASTIWRVLGALVLIVATVPLVVWLFLHSSTPDAPRRLTEGEQAARKTEIEQAWVQADAERAAAEQARAQALAFTEHPHSFQDCHPLKLSTVETGQRVLAAVRQKDFAARDAAQREYDRRLDVYRTCKQKIGDIEDRIKARTGVPVGLKDAGRLEIYADKPSPTQIAKVQKEIAKLNADLLPGQAPTVLVTEDMPPAEDWASK
jgi:hypothetical protein